MKLTTWERVILHGTIAAQSGNAGVMRQCAKLLDKTEFTPNEKAKIGFEVTGDEIRWHSNAIEWDIDFSREQLDLLKKWLNERQWAGTESRWVVALLDKFGVE